MSEHEVQKAGLELLNKMPRVMACRNNSGAIKKAGRYIEYGLRSKRGETGSPDTIILVDGVICACEVKDPGKEPTPEQYAWAARWIACGGRWWWATTLQGMIDPVRAILAERNAMRRGADDDKHAVDIDTGETIGEPVGEPVGEKFEEPKPKARVVKLDPMLALYGKKRAA